MFTKYSLIDELELMDSGCLEGRDPNGSTEPRRYIPKNTCMGILELEEKSQKDSIIPTTNRKNAGVHPKEKPANEVAGKVQNGSCF